MSSFFILGGLIKMNVSNYLAQNIVEDMKEIINQDVNYFDSNGVIIASTNKDRVGAYHGGAKKVLSFQKDIIIRYDGEFAGARKGINLPVYFEDQIVGVIGITGERVEVEKYGKIIQRMTEILIKEAYIKEQEKIEMEGRRQFVEELLFRYHSDDRSLLTRAELLSVKVDLKRIVFVARVVEQSEGETILTPAVTDNIFNYFRSQIEYNAQNLIAQSGLNIIIIYELKDLSDTEALLDRMKNYIERKYNVKVYFGIGNIYGDIRKIKKSYKEAKKSLDLSLALKDKEIRYYKDLDIGLLIDDLSISTINRYIKRVFKDMSREEINEYSIVVDSYIRHNGSITRAAKELYIHKNTLQYRLNKLYDLTGFNPRNLNDLVVLYLAFTLFRLEF